MNATTPPKFTLTTVPDAALVFEFHLTEIREMDTLNELEDEIFMIMRSSPLKQVILDMDNVNSISSFGLGLMVQIHKECQRLGKSLRLCNLSQNLSQLFHIAHLNTLLVIRESRESALAE